MAQGEQPNRGANAGPIALASVAGFRIADIAVDPPALTLSAARWMIRLEPRVMQVLVALAQAEGAVVGREMLNRRCWGGVVVSNEALTRAVFALRRAVAEAPVPSFVVETVPRVGYRLVLSEGGRADPAVVDAVPAQSEPLDLRTFPAASTAPRGPILRIAAAFAVMIAAATALLVAHPWRPTTPEWRIVDRAVALPEETRIVGPTLSADGRLIAFARAGALDEPGPLIMRSLLGPPTERTIVPDTFRAGFPAFAPQADRVAFTFGGPDRRGRIVIAPVAGGVPHIYLTDRSFNHEGIAWDKDGRSILLGIPDQASEPERIERLHLSSGRLREITHPPLGWDGDDMPALSPDGARLAFRRARTSSNVYWIVRTLADGGERVLWHGVRSEESLARWLPDGSGLLFANERGGSTQLGFLPLEGPMPPPTLITDGDLEGLSTDRAGNALLLVTQRTATLAVAGDPARAFATPPGKLRTPALAADGTLAVITDRAGGDRLAITLPNGPARLFDLGYSDLFGTAWSPDGRLLAVGAQDETGLVSLVVDRAGRVVRRIHLPTLSRNVAAWTEHGRALVVPVAGREEPGDIYTWNLWRYALAGGPARPTALRGWSVTRGDGDGLYAPRGLQGVGDLDVYRVDLPTPRKLVSGMPHREVINWTVGRGRLWRPDRADKDHPTLVAHSVQDGHVVERLPAPGLGGRGTGLTIDPASGRPVYVRAAAPVERLWLLGLARN